MGHKDPRAISREWLENRYGCAAAQSIMEEIANADSKAGKPANDDYRYPEMVNRIA